MEGDGVVDRVHRRVVDGWDDDEGRARRIQESGASPSHVERATLLIRPLKRDVSQGDHSQNRALLDYGQMLDLMLPHEREGGVDAIPASTKVASLGIGVRSVLMSSRTETFKTRSPRCHPLSGTPVSAGQPALGDRQALDRRAHVVGSAALLEPESVGEGGK